MIIFMLACLAFLFLCGCMFGTWGILLGIAGIIGVIVYSCHLATKDEENSTIVQEPKPDPETEPFCTPITTDDLLATYCADKVVNERFKI